MSYVDKFVLLAFNLAVMAMVATFIRWKCRAGDDTRGATYLSIDGVRKLARLSVLGLRVFARSAEEVRPQVPTHEMYG